MRNSVNSRAWSETSIMPACCFTMMSWRATPSPTSPAGRLKKGRRSSPDSFGMPGAVVGYGLDRSPEIAGRGKQGRLVTEPFVSAYV